MHWRRRPNRDLATLARNSITGSFLDDAAKARHLARIDKVVGEG